MFEAGGPGAEAGPAEGVWERSGGGLPAVRSRAARLLLPLVPPPQRISPPARPSIRPCPELPLLHLPTPQLPPHRSAGAGSSKAATRLLPRLGFWRIVLDEAQLVANSNSVAAEVVSSLYRRHAWVVTGGAQALERGVAGWGIGGASEGNGSSLWAGERVRSHSSLLLFERCTAPAPRTRLSSAQARPSPPT